MTVTKHILNFVTGNNGKFKEFSDAFNSKLFDIQQVNIDLPEIQELDAKTVIQEKPLLCKPTEKFEC